MQNRTGTYGHAIYQRCWAKNQPNKLKNKKSNLTINRNQFMTGH